LRAAARWTQGFTTIRDLERKAAGYGDIEIKQATKKAQSRHAHYGADERDLQQQGIKWKDTRRPTCQRERKLVDGPVKPRPKPAPTADRHGADWIKVYIRTVPGGQQGNLISQTTLHTGRTESRRKMKRQGGGDKKSALPRIQTESDCSARWMADEIRSSMAWKYRPANRANGRQGIGIADDFAVLRRLGPANTPGGKRDRARAAVHEASFKKGDECAPGNRYLARTSAGCQGTRADREKARKEQGQGEEGNRGMRVKEEK